MKSKKLWLYGCAVVIVILIISHIAMQGAALEVVKVTTGEIEQYVEETGTVKSHDSRTVYMESPGRVTEVLVEKGDSVSEGALLLKIDPTEQRITEIAVKQARNDYDLKLKDWEKTKRLYAGGALSLQEYETDEAALKNTADTYQAAVLKLNKSTKNTLLRSPRAGAVLDRLVEPNLYVAEGTAAFIIGELSDLEIEADILAEEAVNIRQGNPVVISGKATGNAILRGTVSKITPMAKNVLSDLGVNQKRRTVTVKLTGGNGSLKPGVDVDVKIITTSKSGALKIPLSALFDYQGRTCVFSIEKSRARLRSVVKGIENNEMVEIKSGLKSGESVLLKPDNTVEEGMKIKVTGGNS
jgi:HlyD family secretion protein